MLRVPLPGTRGPSLWGSEGTCRGGPVRNGAHPASSPRRVMKQAESIFGLNDNWHFPPFGALGASAPSGHPWVVRGIFYYLASSLLTPLWVF